MNFELLYKFQNVNINSLSALSNQDVWFANQKSFNDPFEGVHKLEESCNDSELINLGVTSIVESKGLSHSEALEIVTGVFNEKPESFRKDMIAFAYEINQKLWEYAKACGVLSLSSDIPGDERSHVCNMLMWSHYGDALRGFCLQFNGPELYESLSELNEDSKFAWAKMDYDTNPRTIRLASGADYNSFDYLKALQIKHEQWLYECELRIFSNGVGLKRFSKEALRAVYIGEKMPLNEEYLLIEIVKRQYPNADIFKVKLESDSFAIRIGRKRKKSLE